MKFIPIEFLAVGSETNTKFADIDLSEGEWYDVDEKSNDEVSIVDVSWEISRS